VGGLAVSEFFGQKNSEKRSVSWGKMAGIVTYEIAAPPDRAFELSKFVASAIGDATKAEVLMKSLAEEKNFESFVCNVLETLGSVARASSDDGEWRMRRTREECSTTPCMRSAFVQTSRALARFCFLF
jgi:hypothetical protein